MYPIQQPVILRRGERREGAGEEDESDEAEVIETRLLLPRRKERHILVQPAVE